MMQEECEDVLLSNSPLDAYLKEVAPLSFSTFQTQTIGVEKEEIVSLDVKCKTWLFKKQTQSYEILQACEVLLEVSSLTDEDACLLVDLKDAMRHELSKYSSEKAKMIYFEEKFVIVAIVAAITALLVYFGKSSYEGILVLLLLFTIVAVILWYAHKYYLSLPKQIFTGAARYCETTNALDKLLDKVVLHLKEVEIINHGHINFQSQSVLHASPLKCLKLRNALMSGLESLFMKIRTNERVLLNRKLGAISLDYKEEYIALLSLDKFSNFFSKTETEASGETLIPLDQIKALICVYRCLLSEFVYRTIVCLYASCSEQLDDNIQLVNDVLYSIDDINNCANQCTETIQTYYVSSMKLVYKKEKQVAPSKVISQVQTTDSLLHSAEIQLHAALARVNEMKSILLSEENRMSEKQTEVLKVLFLNYTLSLENSKSCVEDVLEKFAPDKSKSEVKADALSTSVNVDESIEPYVRLHEQNEPEGDAMFEGESEGFRLISNSCTNSEDMEKMLKESRESKKLMKELKTILSVKETPVGLLSFPLHKPTIDELESDSDKEYMCEETEQQKTVPKQYQSKRSFDYDPENNDCSDSEDIVEETVPRIGLPVGLLQNLQAKSNVVEETFGSSDEEELLNND